jgi:hypothetical protein
MLYATLVLQMGNPLSEESVFSSTVRRPFGRSFEEITFKLIVGHRKTCRKFLLLYSKKMKEKKHYQLNRSFSGVKNLFTNCSRDSSYVGMTVMFVILIEALAKCRIYIMEEIPPSSE